MSLVSVLGAAVLVVKIGALVLAVGAGRRALARVHVEHVAPLGAAWAVPGSALSVALAAGWSTALESARSAPLADLCGYVATLVGVAGAAYLVLLMVRHDAGSAGNVAVNPWL